ncbi:hypothetical protein CVT24_011275 [Panaeolus cyanescens]|uniref:Uncharacterized protein n=1 Tax=Panaeolus cyanescens TaxID=181874 RepID=A0A409VLQ5_9AGAR|nr:hypothetical protein CVT24_011275 [Panaeolus cyanescens]
MWLHYNLLQPPPHPSDSIIHHSSEQYRSMGTTYSQSDEEEHIPDREPEDIILETKSILMTRLPKELVDIIVEEAEFWLSATSEHDYGRGSPFVVENGPNDPVPFDRQRCCAITPEMSTMIPHKFLGIRRVKFTISSHDQGWGGESNLKGQYEGSWTWFEARIVRALPEKLEAEGITSPEPYLVRDLDMGTKNWSETIKNPYATKDGTGSKDPQVINGTGDTWTIRRNLRANNKFRKRVVVWSWDDELEANEERKLNGQGIGQGAGFVEALGKDDRIAVMARARYPGWMNFVESVTIEVFYSI